MAATVGSSIAVQSRFAALKIEDDEIDFQNIGQKKKSNKQKDTKKKSKKQVVSKIDQSSELKSLAFGKSLKFGQLSQNKTVEHSNNCKGSQWEQWKKADSEFIDDTYEKDLQQALLLSTLDKEKKIKTNQDNPTSQTNGDAATKSNKNKKKKKKENKQQVLSLQEFNNAVEKPPMETNSVSAPEPDSMFFDRLQTDASNLVLKEKKQQDFKKQCVAESALNRQHKAEMEKKDKELHTLQDLSMELAKELKIVKKRNEKLCQIIGHGEMKEKSSLLLEIEDLTQIRDELTNTVEQLTHDLEKERSKSRTLQTNLDKFQKNLKHSNKSG